VRRVDEHLIAEREQLTMQAVIQQTGQLLRSMCGRKVGPADIADE